jgi:hypothetical protein
VVIDDLRVAQLALDFLDAPLDEALLLAGGMVLGVLGQVAVGARLGNRRHDARTVDGLQPLQLLPQHASAPALVMGTLLMTS